MDRRPPLPRPRRPGPIPHHHLRLSPGGAPRNQPASAQRITQAKGSRVSHRHTTPRDLTPVPGGVAVEGNGRGAAAHASFEWIRDAPVLAYWGDMDADGLEILSEFRAAGVPAASLFMDIDAYEKWERYGTNIDQNGKMLGPRTPRPVPHLTPAETE